MPFITRLPALTGADPYPDALLALDFVGARRGPQYYKALGVTTADITKIPGWTYTGGASTGSYAAKADGSLQLFAQNVPRITDAGYWAEEARTNSIPNNGTDGAVVGVIGSGGALPTGMGRTVVSGLTYEVVSIGIGAYGPYIDLRVYGTNSSGGVAFPGVNFTSGTTIVAATAQTWTGSFYSALIAGSASGVTAFNVNMVEGTAAGGYVTNGVTTYSPTSSVQRAIQTRTLSGGATVARVYLAQSQTIAAGATVDYTLRVSLPQMELGSFATSPIPTTSVAVTRAADVGYVSAFSAPTDGTILVTGSAATLAASPILLGMDTDTGSIFAASAQGNQFNGTTSIGGTGTFTVSPAVNSLALAYTGTSSRSLSVNGSAVTTSATSKGAFSRVTVGTKGLLSGAQSVNAPIRRIVIYPRAFANSELQAITTAGAY